MKVHWSGFVWIERLPRWIG
ncbi:hypothetical protein CFP56_019111 [Quercus suber]|uniref:Uncharacterized protein n=1 Tax=Quercus suber TaxID=58331 RepID=A0AAW0M2W1_QUESU